MIAKGYRRTALFVDFDNIFIGLGRQQTEAAELFATNPDKWVRWLELGASLEGEGERNGGSARRILVRRCYINPRSFQAYRPHFIRAGFEVVDCPPLTSQGKTSADIHMVIDMLDALDYPTHFDEFIILSGDADFTPVLLRLRKHDRRTIALAVGPVSPAYRASSDILLDESTFLEQGLGIEGEDDSRREISLKKGLDQRTRKVLSRIAKKLGELASISGRIEAVELPRVYKEFSEFSNSNWLGFRSLRNMTEAIVAVDSSLEIQGDDPWSIGLGAASRPSESPPEADSSKIPAIKSLVEAMVAKSETPVVLATIAQRVTTEFGDSVRESSWLGAGSFRGLIDRLELDCLQVSQVSPGYVFDSARHDLPKQPEESKSPPGELSEVVQRISKLTETPALPTATYAAVLKSIAKEVNENGYHLTRTSKAVRDRCAGKAIAVARSSVSFILKGIVFAGHELGTSPESPVILGEILVRNTFDLCSRAQVEIGEEDQREIHEWILGGLDAGGGTPRPTPPPG